MRGTGYGRQSAKNVRPQGFWAFSPFKKPFLRNSIKRDKLKQRVDVIRVFRIKISKNVGKSVWARQRCNAGAFALAHALYAAKRDARALCEFLFGQHRLSEAHPTTQAAIDLAAVTTCRTDRQDWCVVKHAKVGPICNVVTLH